MNLSVSAAVGFISLFGVAVMTGVLYFSEINRRRRAPGTTLRDAVIAGAQTQLRPVLMVAVVAALGMVPAMVARGIGSDIQRPLATVVVGGLTSTLILTPVVLPAVAWVGARLGRRRENGNARGTA
jgi:cobalt-zinc-cadmium resistance protein CzcA